MIANFRWLSGLMLLLALFLTGCSDSSEQSQTSTSGADADAETEEQETTTWRFALEEVEGSVQDAYAQEFKKRIEEQSEGAISVEIYPYGALGTSSQLTELVQNGALELAFASPGHLASVIPEVGIFTLHFVLSDDNDINKKILSSDQVHEILQPAYHEQNMHLLSIVPEGWMVWSANKPLRTPADFDNFKMRTMTSPILTAAYEAYGANPTPKPYSEVYSALQLGEIDGQVNPIFAIEEMSFYEEQDYLIQAKHEQFISTFLAGQSWFQGLPQEQQEMITQVRNEMVDWIYQEQAEYNDERLQIIKDAGGTEVITLTNEERQAFREASQPVREMYLENAGERGQKLLDYVTTQVEELTNE
ncbi:TRAP transporter substrate-binding protein DctP [Hydrocarboniclastica marina]|uniref:C4-dicarboxylate ABC transporter n=1 Tax=Hydrocarboniclastica marina TaxID=2259620 RepID=A0A4P7XIW2_9ALTE|nr:TRAP transporter substrate-binding protein DctP [Hydrocarboniclastica marina]QCF26683.1 C4-dicarboxylate ABC transporter [Hydrocarboniclastica marina]